MRYKYFLPPQASIYATEASTELVDDIIRSYEGVERVDWLVGANFPSFYYNLQATQNNAPYFSQAMVKMDSFQTANKVIPELQERLNREIPSAQILVRKLEQGPPFKAPIELRVYGENLDTLKSIGEDIRLILANTPHVTHTRETLQPGTPKVWLKVDEDTAKLNGITLNQFANMLQATLVGRETGSVTEGSESIPIRVRVANEERENLSHLATYVCLFLPIRIPQVSAYRHWPTLNSPPAWRLLPDAMASALIPLRAISKRECYHKRYLMSSNNVCPNIPYQRVIISILVVSPQNETAL